MDFADLTPEEQALIGQAERWLRGALSSLVHYADDSDFNLKQQFYTDNVLPLFNQLDNADIIPNTSGLAGSSDLTVGQLKAVFAWLFGIQTDIDTNLSIVVKAIGINAGDESTG